MKTRKTAGMLEDKKVNVKVRLALLWAAMMFIYIYNDIFSIYQPGHVAELAEGHLEGVHFTQTLLFGAAILMAFPSFMVLQANVYIVRVCIIYLNMINFTCRYMIIMVHMLTCIP